jgi:hypothetical protein
MWLIFSAKRCALFCLWPLGKGIKIDFYSEVTQEDSDTPNGGVIMRMLWDLQFNIGSEP